MQLSEGASRFGSIMQGLWNECSARNVQEALKDCSPASTIVHVHGWTKALSASVFHAAIKLGFPIVVTLHDYFAICPNGSLYSHPDRAICTLTPMDIRCIATNCDSRNYGVKLYRVLRQAIQRAYAGMPHELNGFISVSSFSQSIIARHLPARARIFAVRNPIDREREPRVDVESNVRFMYLGRLSPEKGPILFANAARAAGVLAIFAGDGPCSGEVAAANPEAQLLGWLDAGQVGAALRGARALVFPSLWYETYGLSVMEAAATGVPAIVPDTSASRELVIDNVTGLWFQGGNIESLIAKLRELASPGVAERLGGEAYQRYWDDPPTMARHVDALLDVYECVLENAA
jgi:glycosyltransferase involved in cell wall biosynthesis